MSNTRTSWIITDGKKGTENQCLGLAAALDLNPSVIQIKPKFPWSILPPSLWFFPLQGIDGLPKEKWPDVLIAASRSAAAVAAKIRQMSGGEAFTIFLQNPHLSCDKFDIVIAPSHDQLKGRNVISTLGCVHSVTPAILEKTLKKSRCFFAKKIDKKIGILLGGKTRHYKMLPEDLRKYGQQFKELSFKKNAGYMITASRRSDKKCLDALMEPLQDVPHFLWDGRGDNPYFDILAQADIIVVTADSVSMISEAISTGKPVYVLPLKGFSKKLDRFHQALLDKGIVRMFDGRFDHWSYKIPPQTNDIVMRMQELGYKAF
jgi:mitochondrial fission protein ELM1